MKTVKFDIYGDYVDVGGCDEDVTPTAFRRAVKDLGKGDALEVHVNSCGGSVTAGLAIANTIRDLSAKGCKTVCVVDGLAASIASITAMACDEVRMFPQSFIMIHNPWTMAMGDAGDLRKEAQTLDAMRDALVSFYRMKFDRTDAEIVAMMDAETWISGADAAASGLSVTLLDGGTERAAARLIAKKAYNISRIMETYKAKETAMKDDTEKKDPETPDTPDAPAAPETPAAPDEQKPDEQQTPPAAPDADADNPDETEKKSAEELEEENAALRARIAELEKELAAPTDERVSKCQSVFQAKINNLKSELAAKDGELRNALASASSLTSERDAAKGELAKAQAALAEKTDALEQLNSAVLAHKDEKPAPKMSDGLALCRTPEERSRFLASGNYVRD